MDNEDKKEEVVAPRKYQETLKAKFGDEYNAENELDMMDRYTEESEGDINGLLESIPCQHARITRHFCVPDF